MGLHHQLHALGERLGTSVFDDSDSFRGALDDFLDEGAATTGEINLLVDTVRLGAYQRLLSMINGGADPAAAVMSAGELLARERGSADLDGSRWACAVLGFAADKVPASEVERYDPGTLRPPPGDESVPPTAAAPGTPPRSPTTSPPYPAYGTGPTGAAGPGLAPTGPAPTAAAPAAGAGAQAPYGFGGAPQSGSPVGPGYAAGPGFGGPSAPQTRPPYDGGPPRKKTPWALIVTAVVVVLALAVGGSWFALAGGDSGNQADDPSESPSSSGPSDSSAPTTPAETTPMDGLDASAVAQRYGGLAPALGGVLSTCSAEEAQTGESEHLTCPTSNGMELELVSYDSAASLDNERSATVDNEVGSIWSLVKGRTYYSENPDGTGQPSIYWDDSGVLQSARIQGGSLDDLERTLTTIGAVVSRPAKPFDPDLRSVISENITGLARCKRIEAIDAGMTESNLCRDKKLYIYYSHFGTRSGLLGYRSAVKNISDNNNGTITDWHYTGSPNVDAGKRIEWVDKKHDYAHLYWDVVECNCAMEIIALNDDQDFLYTWWLNED